MIQFRNTPIFIILISAFGFPINAKEDSPKQNAPRSDTVQPVIEIKTGYFFFASSSMRKIYNQGGLDVQLSGSYPIYRWLQIYGSVEALEKHGHAKGSQAKTWLWEIPLSLGLRPVATITSGVRYYFTFGPRYNIVRTGTDSTHVKKHANSGGPGLFVNTGFDFTLWQHFLMDLFGEYSYVPVTFSSSSKNVYGNRVQMGGFTFGGGFGYAF